MNRHLRLGWLHVHLIHLPRPTMAVWFDARYNCEGNDRYDHGWLAAVGRRVVFIGRGGSHG